MISVLALSPSSTLQIKIKRPEILRLSEWMEATEFSEVIAGNSDVHGVF
jgi:hypothetical protein